MRLRTFESFWLIKNGLLCSYPSLQKNLSTEIVVIGGGITGALISHALLNAGHQVALLDRRDIGQGSTSATTSMLQYEIDVPLYELAQKIGEKEAAACYKAGIKAINDLEKLIKKEKIDCGFVAKQSLYIAHNTDAAKWLKDEFEIRDKYKLGVEWLTAAQVKKQYGLKCSGAIRSQTAASIDAYKLAHELIAKNTKRGLQVFDQTEIKNFDYKKNGVDILTQDGNKVKCKKVVFCSGFESLDILNEKVADLISTFACVSEEGIKIPAALNDVLVWDTNDPYIYMRTTDDGRLLIGGEDSKINSGLFREYQKKRKSEKLMKKLEEVLPGINFIQDFNWAGVFGTTKDGLPYIGKHPKFPNAIFVLGFGGNGITFSIQGMQLVTDILKGKENELLEYYRFGR